MTGLLCWTLRWCKASLYCYLHKKQILLSRTKMSLSLYKDLHGAHTTPYIICPAGYNMLQVHLPNTNLLPDRRKGEPHCLQISTLSTLTLLINHLHRSGISSQLLAFSQTISQEGVSSHQINEGPRGDACAHQLGTGNATTETPRQPANSL